MAMLQDPSYLERLPLEIIIHIIKYLPLVDIGNLQLTSWTLNKVCQNECLWKILIKRDMNMNKKFNDRYTWRKTYQAIVTVDINRSLTAGAVSGNFELIKYAVAQGANDYDYALQSAATYGQITVVKNLIENMKSKNLHPDYNHAIQSAARFGRKEIVQLILDYDSTDDNPTDHIYFSILIPAVEIINFESNIQISEAEITEILLNKRTIIKMTLDKLTLPSELYGAAIIIGDMEAMRMTRNNNFDRIKVINHLYNFYQQFGQKSNGMIYIAEMFKQKVGY